VAEGTLRGTDPVTVELESTRPVQSLQWDLHIYQAMTRKKKFEETIKRGTELGVTRFVPVITERTVRVPNNPEKQQRRWQKIATDSARISERDSLPTINKPQSFDDVLSSVSGTVYRAGPEGKSMEEVVESDETQYTVSIFVGPEGGFTEGERNELDETSAGTVRVGERNLRAETASVALITLWLGEKGYL
jgi:16S rRNA (uracil1498-N3)-methyltransferase